MQKKWGYLDAAAGQKYWGEMEKREKKQEDTCKQHLKQRAFGWNSVRHLLAEVA